MSVRFPQHSVVDFVIVGSGAAGGIMARELSRARFSVVVLEQGPRLTEDQFKHDELGYLFQHAITNNARNHPQSFRKTTSEEARPGFAVLYGRMVGGSNAHFTANFWRMRPIDFHEASALGGVSGSGLADWPITYAELEPYYTRAEWQLGVSGAPGPFDPPRSRPYPMQPLPNKSSGVIFERATRQLGYHPQPAPLAINSRPYRGRPACQHCGWCMSFLCEFRAKSTSLHAMLPEAEAGGRCEVRPNSYVRKIETDRRGRVTGVIYFDADRREQLQRARAVVLCANGAETPRLLLNSASSRFPDGLANSSGLVGKHLMFNGSGGATGTFEHELNEYKSVQTTRLIFDFYETDPRRGFYGGGGIDARFQAYPIGFGLGWLDGGPSREVPTWGPGFKQFLRESYTRTMYVATHSTSLPLEANSISLDPVLRDDWGVPAIRVTYKDHPDDVRISQFLIDRAMEILEAAGARRRWAGRAGEQDFGVHLLGTCRMGDDPRTSVVDRFHRAHDVRNLFMCDGSSLVTSTRGQPTETISALAFRAAAHIARFARRGEI